MTETFDTSAQYDDWRGTAAADNNVHKTIQTILSDRGLKAEGEFLVGVSLFTAEPNVVSISAYLIKADNFEAAQKLLENEPVPTIKKVSVDNLSVTEFADLFKRFSVNMSWQGMNLMGRELNIEE